MMRTLKLPMFFFVRESSTSTMYWIISGGGGDACEYLLKLREAHHSNQGSPVVKPITVGDIVLVHDEDQPRGFWKLGRVEKVITGKDRYEELCWSFLARMVRLQFYDDPYNYSTSLRLIAKVKMIQRHQATWSRWLKCYKSIRAARGWEGTKRCCALSMYVIS